MEKDIIKQVILIRKDLNMRKGKIAAQAAHASMKVFFDMMYFDNIINKYALQIPRGKIGSDINRWVNESFTKICLQVNSEKELLDFFDKAKEQKLPCSLIKDAGHTEFHNIPTFTTVAIGPASSKKIDKLTGHLKLM